MPSITGASQARLTARQLNRATLDRQLLLRREPLDVVEAVRRVTALQAQEPPSPYIALWNRVADFDPAALDVAFERFEIVKATLVRVTLHAVDAADYPHFHDAMQTTLRAARYADGRFRRTGLTAADADALAPRVAAFASRPRTNAEMEAWLREEIGPKPEPGVWWALRQVGPFVHAPTGGPWSFGPRPSYVAAPDQPRSGDRAAAVTRLVRRYLEGFGPASIADIARFVLLQRPIVRAAVESLGDELVRVEGPAGQSLLDIRSGVVPDEDVPAPPRLMAMWDSTLLAYEDRGRVIPDDVRRLVIRSNGDVLPALLIDGYVAGVWRPLDDGIEATAFRPLPDDVWTALDEEARGLRAFLAPREPLVYRRYSRWWPSLPKVDVRLLGQTSAG